MKSELHPWFPPGMAEAFIDAPEGRFSFAEVEHEVLDEGRVHALLGILETVRLWGGEDRALLREVAAKMEAVHAECASIGEGVKALRACCPGTRIVPIETLDAKLRLQTPIFAVLEHNEGIVTATYYECEIFGEGETEFEALEDLRESVKQYFLQLRESRNDLGPVPARHLSVLEGTILER